MTSPTPNRRRFQFSLRTLLIGITLVAIFLAWVVPKYQRQQREEEAFSWVERCGGKIVFEEGYEDQRDASRVQELHLGRFTFESFLNYSENSLPVKDISLLSVFTNLKILDLRISEVSDLAPLARLERLEGFSFTTGHLREPMIDLAPLGGLKNLKHLHIDSLIVEDISPLANLPNLKSLHFVNTQVDDVSPLMGLKKLELVFGNTGASNEQVRLLRESLPGCRITL